MMKEEPIDFIQNKLTERELLEQLAEEASELSQAALKLIRAAGMNNNPTPISKEDALDNFIEEFYDVYNAWCLLGLKNKQILRGSEEYLTARLGCKKLERWAERLGYGEE